ncbi:hypothetical protein EVAR_81588_1 [Eumeta japonica]|uniref:Uncharacterized protein n=1 Tax=Eumeta variegata TaxID=151549 RepID=A0A4C1V0R5_EUMVA|nr:hypothetical protein EVAR_81588_1 [Eumeta japonica]
MRPAVRAAIEKCTSVGEPSESRWSPPPTDTRKLGGVTNTLLASRMRIGYQMERVRGGRRGDGNFLQIETVTRCWHVYLEMEQGIYWREKGGSGPPELTKVPVVHVSFRHWFKRSLAETQ